MIGYINKRKLMWTTVLMITFGAEKAMAFPLPTFDLKRIATGLRDAYYQVMEIKQEVESNLKIIKEITNGGYGAAAKDLFAKIQNGDYDRFGNNLFSLGEYAKAGKSNFQSFKDQKERENELRSQGMAEDVAREQAQLEGAGKRAATERARQEALRNRSNKEKNDTFFNNAYDWLKDNRSVTNDAFSAIDAGKSGNAGGVVGSLLHGTGGAINSAGNEGLGNIFQQSSGAGNALNSAMSGNWGNALGQLGGAVGGAVGSTGNENNNNRNIGNTISSASGNTGNALNNAFSGNWGGVVSSGMQGAGDVLAGTGGDVAGGATSGSAYNAGNAVNNFSNGNWGDGIVNTVFGAAGGMEGAANAAERNK